MWVQGDFREHLFNLNAFQIDAFQNGAFQMSFYTAFQADAFQNNAFQVMEDLGMAVVSIVEIRPVYATVSGIEPNLTLARVSIVEISS